MGWLSSSAWRNASAVRDHLRNQLKESGYTVLDDASTTYGRVYYALIEKPPVGDDLDSGVAPTIFVALIEPRGDGWWGYKDMDESMGPYVVDCPLRIIDKAAPSTSETAHRWRQCVRDHHARRQHGAAILKQARSGDKVWLTHRPQPYTVSYVRGRSLIGYRHDGAGPFRLPTAQIARFEPAARKADSPCLSSSPQTTPSQS